MASKGKSSEEIAERLLRTLGYEILQTRKEISLEGTGVAEIDIVARDPKGIVYAVEVKSGKASVSDVRQVYANSKLIDLKPMIICKGFSDKSAELAIKELDVKSILLPEYYLTNLEDIREIVDELIADIILGLERADIRKLDEEEMRALVALSETSSFAMAMDKSGMNRRELGKALASMKKKGIFPLKRPGFSYLSLQARYFIRKSKEERTLSEILEKVKSIDERLRRQK